MQHIAEQQRGWQPEHTLSVAEAIKEAMDDGPPPHFASRVETPHDLPAPEPHLPLRKSSVAHRMQSRKGSIPRPIFTPAQQKENVRGVRGFNPSPVLPSPRIENVTASSEHAFAGREPRRPFKNAMGVLEGQQPVVEYSEQQNQRPPSPNNFEARPPSSPMLPYKTPPESAGSPRKNGSSLKHSKSVGDGLRNLRQRVSSKGNKQGNPNGRLTPDSGSPFSRPGGPGDEARGSFRSGLTSHSSFGHESSVLTTQTTHTSLSSSSEYVKIHRGDYDEGGLTDIDMSVEDAIGMYEDGFDSGHSARPSPRPSVDFRSIRSADVTAKNSLDVRSVKSLQLERPASQPKQNTAPKRPFAAHRRSQSASILILGVPRVSLLASSPSPALNPPAAENKLRSSMQIVSNKNLESRPNSSSVPRDRYGFKKASHYITAEQYDEWDRLYSQHIERRTKKWHALMKQYGLSTSPALRFPAKSDKTKRYVRKGIPPEFRGAAWFWYAGGPGILAKEQGLYLELLQRVEDGELTDNDREHIERDLNRTFPDNIKFKPDPTTMNDAQAGAGGGVGGPSPLRASETVEGEIATPKEGTPDSKRKGRRQTKEPETPIVQALRRVLQAFAVHNPQIGYCQSLNFIAGLLLLFLDQDEQRAFILLNIVTNIHLPGTHGVTLEGANIDIAVLMSFIKDSLPGVWSKLDDKKEVTALGAVASVAGGVAGLQLPTVSLATTAWFMSLFVGTLPIESVLRVWDCLFFEGSKTLFRIALAIFKAGESQILQVSDPMEIFQVVQTIPRSMLDANSLLEVCFRRRGGFGNVSQDKIEFRRAERRKLVKEGVQAGNNALARFKTRLRSRPGARTSGGS